MEGWMNEASKVHRRADLGVLKDQEAGAKIADLARRHGVSEATIYNWKAKYGGLGVSEAKRLRALEDKNAKLKQPLAEAMLDNAGLKIFLQKLVTPAAKREAAARRQTVLGMSERRAFRFIGAARNCMRYQSQRGTNYMGLSE